MEEAVSEKASFEEEMRSAVERWCEYTDKEKCAALTKLVLDACCKRTKLKEQALRFFTKMQEEEEKLQRLDRKFNELSPEQRAEYEQVYREVEEEERLRLQKLARRASLRLQERAMRESLSPEEWIVHNLVKGIFKRVVEKEELEKKLEEERQAAELKEERQAELDRFMDKVHEERRAKIKRQREELEGVTKSEKKRRVAEQKREGCVHYVSHQKLTRQRKGPAAGHYLCRSCSKYWYEHGCFQTLFEQPE